MAMLAEKRRKCKFVLTPKAKPLWTLESSGMKTGKKLMEKMGWSAGKGLGASEQGIAEPLRSTYKQDSKGMGYTGQGNPFENLDQFNALLASLSGSQDGDNGKEMSFESLEEKSMQSRSRVHYKKFTHGKDLSKYSTADLSCIVGIGRKTEEPEPDKEEDEDRTGEEEHAHGVTTINAGSIADYFQQKLANRKIHAGSGVQDDGSSVMLAKESSKKSKKKKSRDQADNPENEYGEASDDLKTNREDSVKEYTSEIGEEPTEKTKKRKDEKDLHYHHEKIADEDAVGHCKDEAVKVSKKRKKELSMLRNEGHEQVTPDPNFEKSLGLFFQKKTESDFEEAILKDLQTKNMHPREDSVKNSKSEIGEEPIEKTKKKKRKDKKDLHDHHEEIADKDAGGKCQDEGVKVSKKRKKESSKLRNEGHEQFKPDSDFPKSVFPENEIEEAILENVHAKNKHPREDSVKDPKSEICEEPIVETKKRKRKDKQDLIEEIANENSVVLCEDHKIKISKKRKKELNNLENKKHKKRRGQRESIEDFDKSVVKIFTEKKEKNEDTAIKCNNADSRENENEDDNRVFKIGTNQERESNRLDTELPASIMKFSDVAEIAANFTGSNLKHLPGYGTFKRKHSLICS